jgi:Domain of unknown function (DUF4136)
MKGNTLRLTFSKLAILGLLVGSSHILAAQKVQTDYDKSKNLSNYHSYYWAKVELPNPIWNQRLQDGIDAQLEKKGWSKQQAGGEVAIVALGMSQTKQDLQTFYSGDPWMYRGWGGMGMGTSTTSVNEYKQGTLVVDLYDSNSRELLWRGTATDTIADKPEKNEKKLNKIVKKMFAKFPPESQ